MKIAVAFLACLAIANAIPVSNPTILKPFPHGKTVVYDYFAVAKTGVLEPALFASEIRISAKIYFKHHDEEPHGYYMVLQDIKMGSGVGSVDQVEPIISDQPIAESNLALQQPAIIIYNEAGQITGMSVDSSMPSWASNFLRGIVSNTLQIDLPNIKFTEPFKPYSFTTKENNIYGKCSMSYDIYRKKDAGDNVFMIHKFESPLSCSNFTISRYNFEDIIGCPSSAEIPLTAAMSQVFEIENQGENIFIKKITAHHEMDYFFWKGNSEVHYIINDFSMTFDKFVDPASIELPSIVPSPAVDITYQEPKTRLAPDAGIDFTQKHHISQEKTIEVFKILLSEAVAYIQKNHVDMADPDFEHGQTINWMMDVMKGLEFTSLKTIFSEYEAATSAPNAIIKQLFIRMLPHSGTTATWNFAMHLIKNKEISTFETVEMLSTIALKLREPSLEHTVAIDAILAAKETLDPVIVKSVILCRASLFYRIFKDTNHPESNPIFKNYMDHIYDRIINEPSHDMKIVYLMAFKNIQIGNIMGRLDKIIRGELEISENPVDFRLKAIWAVQDFLDDVDYFSIFWPIMSDSDIPLKIRIAAYDILLRYNPCIDHVLKIHWFMKYEQNIHFQNYHYTTMKSLASSVNSRNDELKQIAVKILRMTEAPVASYPLSASYISDSVDQVYGYGNVFEASIVRDEQSGNPEVIYMAHTTIKNVYTVKDLEIYLSIQGFDQLSMPPTIHNQKVFEILKKAAADMPAQKAPRFDTMIVYQGQVIFIQQYNADSIETAIQDIRGFIARYQERAQFAQANIFYSTIDELHTFSPMGLPIKMETKIPQVHWVDFDFELVTPGHFTIKFVNKIWSHGISSVSFYSALSNAWHFVGRSTVFDASFEVAAQVEFDFSTGSIEISFPAVNDHPVSGVKIHNEDVVGVMNVHIFDSEATINSNIKDSSRFIAVTKRNMQKKHSERTRDCEISGMKFVSAVFDCENGRTAPWIRKEWQDIFSKEQMKIWNNWAIRGLLAVSQQWLNYWFSPQPVSCGYLAVIQPSPIHALKSIKINFENHVNGSQKDFSIQLKTIPWGVDNFSHSWKVKLTQNWNEQLRQQIYKLKFIKYNEAKWEMEIDIDVEKNYSVIPINTAKADAIFDIATGKIDIQMQYMMDDIIDIEKIFITFKKERDWRSLKALDFSKPCNIYLNNPSPSKFMAKQIACMKDVISHSVASKYTFDISYNSIFKIMISQIMSIQDKILSIINPHIQQKWNSSLLNPSKIIADFPSIDKKSWKISVISSLHSYDMYLKWIPIQIWDKPIGTWPSLNSWISRGKSSWPWTSMSRSIVGRILAGNSDWNMCSTYPNATIPYDWRYISYAIPNEYTLISGDYVNKNFAIFAKLIGNKLAMNIHIPDGVIEISPGDIVQVKINDEIHGEWIPSPDGDVLSGNWPFKMLKVGEQIIIAFEHEPLIVVYKPSGISTVVNQGFQGKVSGICGHMNGIYEVPKAYTLDI